METVIDNIKLQKYSEYVHSGEEWLGIIPKQWELKKVKNVFRLVIEPAPKNNDFELLSVYTDIGVKPRRELEERGNKASTTDGYWFVKKGDIVVNKLLAWMGAIGVSNYDGVTSPAYDILRAKLKIESNYFHYLFRNEACISELRRHSRGIMDMRLRLYFDKFGDIIVPFPNYNDQQIIVEFLDRKTALIDQAIDIKQKQIELLKERRQILIHKAVTRGLNPNVKLKYSGVEWIGEIPDGWEVKRLRNLGKIVNGATPSSGVTSFWDGDITWITPTDINNVFRINQSERTITEQGYRSCGTSLVPKGSVVLTTRAPIGKAVIADKELCTNQGCKSVVLQQDVHSEFIYYFLLINAEKLNSLGTGTTFMELSSKELKNFIFPVPPNSEQISICNYINNNSTKIFAAISLKEKEIEKLKEYKATLINSAVTGKIKVC